MTGGPRPQTPFQTPLRPTAQEAYGKPYTPAWVIVVLEIGAIALLIWAIAMVSSLSEPSATGRSRAALVFWAVDGIVGLVLTAASVVGLVRREPWGRPLAWAGSVTLVLSLVGTLLGVPALVGLLLSRNQSRP